jgi:hypothetical protein
MTRTKPDREVIAVDADRRLDGLKWADEQLREAWLDGDPVRFETALHALTQNTRLLEESVNEMAAAIRAANGTSMALRRRLEEVVGELNEVSAALATAEEEKTAWYMEGFYDAIRGHAPAYDENGEPVWDGEVPDESETPQRDYPAALKTWYTQWVAADIETRQKALESLSDDEVDLLREFAVSVGAGAAFAG